MNENEQNTTNVDTNENVTTEEVKDEISVDENKEPEQLTEEQKKTLEQRRIEYMMSQMSEKERKKVQEKFLKMMNDQMKIINSKHKKSQSLFTKPPTKIKKIKNRARRLNQKTARRANRVK